jgi:hypothetical protein
LGIHADWLLEEIIEPVFRELADFDVIRADKIAQPGMIDAQIIRYLIDADLVVADLSSLNPNAFYEIGIRHMVQKPIIHMQLEDDKIPFDVSLYRATKFSRNKPSDLRNARAELKRAVAAVNSPSYEVDNPVTRARGQLNLELHATPEQRVLIEQVRSIQIRLDAIEGVTKADEPRGVATVRRKLKRKQAPEAEAGVIELDEGAEPEDIGRITSIIADHGYYFTTDAASIRVPAVEVNDENDLWKDIRKCKGVRRLYTRWEPN